MRKFSVTVMMLGMMTGLVGCGVDSGTTADVNDTAKAVLPGTWADSNGQFNLTFDENGQITGFTCATLPPELADLKFDGSTFTITIPGTTLTVDAQLMLEQATVDDTGFVTIRYHGELVDFFSSLADPGYVEIVITGQLDNVDNPTRMTGTLNAIAYPSSFIQSLANLPAEVSVGENVTFDVSKG